MATRSIPQPPFSAEVLADLHADNVTTEVGEQLWPVVRRDPDALTYLRSLDTVSTELRALGRDDRIIHQMPDDVFARLTDFVDSLDEAEEPTERLESAQRVPAEPAPSEEPTEPHASEELTDRVATIHHLPFSGESPESRTAPTVSGQAVEPVRLADRRRRRLALAAAAAVAAVAATAGVLTATLRGGGEEKPQATPPTGTIELGNELTATAAMSVLGRNDVTGKLAGPTALNRCIHANNLDRTVLGSTNTTFQGKDAVLILLTGPTPHKITALVVGSGCTTEDPQQLATADIG